MTATELPYVPGSWMGAAVTIAVAVISSTGGYSIFQFIFNRTGRKAEIARTHAETEKLQQEVGLVQAQWLIEAHKAVQQETRDAADVRYHNLYEDYKTSSDQLKGLRRVTIALVYATDVILQRFRPGRNGDNHTCVITAAEYAAAQAAVAAAREAL